MGIDSSWIFALLSLVIGTEEEIAGLDSDLGGEGFQAFHLLGALTILGKF
jgi:hypothetical protein